MYTHVYMVIFCMDRSYRKEGGRRLTSENENSTYAEYIYILYKTQCIIYVHVYMKLYMCMYI